MTTLRRISDRQLVSLALVLVAAISHSGCNQRSPNGELNGDPSKEAMRKVVTALGRVTPGRGVLSIGAQPGSRLLKLEVKDGQKLKTEEVLAYLEGHLLRLAERDAAQTALQEARERLEAETAYGEALIEESLQQVNGLQLAVTHESKEVERVLNLTTAKALPNQRLIDHRFLLETRQSELRKANAALAAAKASLARTRVLVGLRSAEAQARTAEAQLELTIIRAPIDGEVLKVLTHAGERIGDEPIVNMGDTANMYIVAEVHETDVSHVRVGQRATVTSPALPVLVEGVIEEIGAMIHKSDVLDIDPRAPKDTRVVEVRIKIAQPERVARFTHLEVSTRIDIDPPTTASR